MSVFKGQQIALDLGISLNFKKKSELRKAIVDNGGTISYIVTKKCHCVVTSDPEKCDVSSKCRMALKYGLPVLNLDYIWDCLAAQKLLSFDAFVVGGKATSLDFKSGIISAGKAGVHAKDKKKKRIAPFNPSSVQVWKDNDPAQPVCDEKELEAAKYAMFTWFNTAANCEESYVVELHAPSQAKSQDSNRQEESDHEPDPLPYRIFFQSASSCGAVKTGQKSYHESRYTARADQALDVYAMLVNSVARKPGAQVCRSPIRGLGSTLLQKRLAEVVAVHEGCSEEVRDLVEHVWREAVSEVTAILGKISAIKLDQVEKADAILSKVSSALQSSQSDSDIEKLAREFYDTLNVKEKRVQADLETKISWKKWLVKKRDLCQLVKDIVCVSEMTNFENQAVVEAKYAALRCRITALSGAAREEVEQLVLTNIEDGQELKVLNVYEIWRQVEDVDFRRDLEPKRLLFHSSRVENFVGILSRGLLLPKVVVDEYGGTRSDAGMLGSGIYFASASSTSVRYSAPSNTKGSRLMLINEVALGKTKDLLEYDTSLTSPPDGYDSTHGVANSDNKDSQFKVHEYVVYKTNQQRIRYLVEFATSEDVPQPLSIPPQDDSYVTSEPTETKNDVSLHDVLDVADPIDKLRPGLVGSGDQEVELKGVHIRAKLIDLAGEVVVLQEYYNNSSEPIEAKYVFPLGEAAAVCGFEAFINGKHVVGEVKEKEKAHKEYKKAISEGHGAYLMDQDEETPDVFTVSVGNLPAGACVLIKITYVTELRVEDEKISFRLPGTVAPWKEKAALEQTTQTDLRSHKTKATRTSVQVAVEMPFDIRTLHCPTHKVKVKQTASKAYVELARHQEFGSGFLLLIGLAEIHVPRMWVEKHPSKPHHQACMLTFYPEFELEEVTEGEIILVLDMSNSMKGTQILKLALLVLQNIPHGFKFNVIRFGSDFEELFPAPKLGTEETAEQARKFIAASSVTMGSTDVRSALRQFYLLPSGDPSSPDLPRNVFLLSDGHLVEESLVLEEAARHSGHTRVFTFGVSSTCNSHTLRALSRVSAGAFEYFDPKTKSKWQPKVKSQISKAMQPGLTSVCVEWQQFDDNLPPPSQAPRQITALFNGSQQIVYGFVPNCTMATLKAVIGGQEVSTVVSTSELSITEGQLVHRLTAKAIIQDWEAGVLDRDRTNHELSKMELKDYVIELSKEYSIVTQLTSFVAVEKREENEKETLPKGPTMQELLNKESVENLPYMGWTSLPEPSLESLIEELSFIDEDKIQDSHQEKVEKTALLEKFYQDQCGKSGPCSLETLQTATVLADSYRHLGERDKADTITVQSFKDASPMLRDLTECDNYPAVAECLADLRRNLSQDIRASQNTRMFIPWPKQGNVSIKVRNLTNALMEFGITQATSVKQLKDMIYARDGLPQDTQRLILNGRQLEDDCRLSDLGADLEDQFYLVQRLRGGGDAPTRYELFSAAKQEESDDDDNEVLGGGLFSDGSYDSTDSESDLCEEEDHSKGEKGASLYESCYAETHFSADEYCCDVEVFKAQATSEEEEEEEMGFGLFDDISDAVQPQSAKVQEKYDDLLEVNLLSDMDCDESKTLSMLEKGDMELNTKKKKKKSKKKPVDSDWAEEDMDDFVGPSRSGRVGRGGFRSTFIAGPPQQVMRSSAPSIGQSLPGTSATPHGLSSFFAPTQQQQQKRFEPAPFSGSSLELTSGAANQPMSAAFGGVTPQPKMVAFRRSAPQPTFGSNIRPSGQEPTFGSGFGESAPQQSLGFGGSAPQQSFGFGESAAQQSFGFGGSAPQQSLGFGGSAPQQSFGFGGSAPQQSLGFGGSAPQQSLGSGFGESSKVLTPPRHFGGLGLPVFAKPPPPPQMQASSGLFASAPPPPPPPQMQASSGLFASVPPPPPPQMQATSDLCYCAPPPPNVASTSRATSATRSSAPPPPPPPAATPPPPPTPRERPPPPTPRERPPPPTPRERPPPPQAVTGCLTPPPALKQKLARLRSSVQAAPFVLAKAKPAPERQKGRSPLPAPPPQREEMKADAVLVPLMHFQNKNYDGDLGSESRSGLDIQRSSPTSLAYSPTSPAYSPTSQALVVADRSSLRGRVTGGKSKEPLSERLIKFSESPVIKELKEKQSEASKKVHGSVIWREIRPQASAVSVESRERSESRSRKASPRSSRDRERSRERAEDGVCLLSLSVAESCADFDTEEEEVQKVKAKYAVMKSRKFSARKRTSEKATNVIEAAVPQKKFWHEAPYGIGTDLSPARVRHRVQLSAENVTKLLQLQNIRGWWQFGPELDKVLGVNSEQCIGVLCKSGLSSLGLKAQDEIQHVLATVLVLFILLNKLLPQFLESDADLVWADILDYLRGLSRDDAWELLEQSFEGSCEHDVARSIIEALDFLTQVDQKYPALYSRLELGTNWFNVAVNLMGRAVVAAA